MSFKFKKIITSIICVLIFTFCSSISTIIWCKPLIVSINGLDGSGKTTQTSLLKSKGEELGVYVPKDLCKYYIHPLDFNWWFKTSTIDEFCDNFYGALYLRKQEALKSNCKFVVFDKGIKTIDARVIANFSCRGTDIESINNTIKKFKEKYGLNDNDEDIKVFLKIKDNTKRIVREEDPNSKDIEKSSYYSKYQKALKILLEDQINDNYFTVINADQSVEKIHNDILKIFLR